MGAPLIKGKSKQKIKKQNPSVGPVKVDLLKNVFYVLALFSLQFLKKKKYSFRTQKNYSRDLFRTFFAQQMGFCKVPYWAM
jgi:hypothetical protein